LARRAGILGVAVLTGETSLVEIAESNIKPDIIMEDIGQLANIIETIKKNNL
jgi:ribonucleotide monophosphatase NagD (HAD superfamily)